MFCLFILCYMENWYYFFIYYCESLIIMYKLFIFFKVYIFIKKIMCFFIYYYNQKFGFYENFRNIIIDYLNISYLKKNFFIYDIFLLQMFIIDEVLLFS